MEGTIKNFKQCSSPAKICALMRAVIDAKGQIQHAFNPMTGRSFIVYKPTKKIHVSLRMGKEQVKTSASIAMFRVCPFCEGRLEKDPQLLEERKKKSKSRRRA